MGTGGYTTELFNRNQSLNNQISDLKLQKRDLENVNNNVSKEKNDLIKENNKLKLDIKTMKDRLEVLEKLQGIEEEKIKIEQEKNELKQKYDIEMENNEIMSKRIEELQKELQRLREIEEEKIKIEQEKNEFKEKYDKEKEDNNALKDEKDNLKKENEYLKYSKMISEEVNLFYNKITNKEIESKIQNKLKALFDEMLSDEAFKKDEILLENQNFKNKIDLFKKNVLDNSIKEFLNDTKHINIILLGKTGVGKSSLINALLDRNEAETGGFAPVTDKIKEYEKGNLRLYDTPGIELTDEKNAANILNEIKTLIKKSEEKKPDRFIHCIWYCVSGKRFEIKVEGKIVDELLNTYKDGKIPIIFAYLQAVDKEGITNMHKNFHDLYPNIDFIPIVSRDIKSQNGMQIPKMGLDKIKEMTIKNFGESINSMSFVHIQNKVNQRVRQKIDNITCEKNLNNLLKTICNLYEKLLGNLDEKNKNEIVEQVKNIINYSKEKLDFNDDIMNYIKDLKNEISKKENMDNINQNEAVPGRKKLKKIKTDEIAELTRLIETFKKKIEELFNNGKNENSIIYKEEIYNFFVKKIKVNAELHIEESFKNIKNELKDKLKNGIQKSPNFQELLK